ncbi:hypothetical protein NNC19_03480 [Clostridium sp. SHJSY1]|uniref:hypothetical protein n=1 Tax=Clostridium sp. SHJSY1 TaxID=2942483 RepID=UPI00287505BA|nr:hypothetical protein [Clostridium sp. SHJSY1]MDS0524727.1 hypothetical protein [Clostridium sp. SHJSY1]
MSKFLKSIFSALTSGGEEKLNKNELKKDTLIEKSKERKRIWKKEYNPFRNVILWGYDENNNPSFLILYGEHQYKSSESNEMSICNVLEDDVKYTSYAVFKGKKDHLPAFQAVRIVEDYYYYNRNKELPKMYYKTGIINYWSKNEEYIVKSFKNLNEEEQVILPYFESNSYEDYIRILEENNISFADFTIAKHPNEILKLDEESSEYYQILYSIFCDSNLYTRKKSLNELIGMNPSKNIYELILKVGSTELVSGLFLQLAKRNNDILVEEAKVILENEINWAEESYANGVKRCAGIYISTFNEELKAERKILIKDSLSDIDLHILNINNKEIPEGKILEGAAYRKYALQGLLSENIGRYDYSQGKWITVRRKQRYKISAYSDGVVLNSIALKNVIQEAEIYGLADVVGKIAYYLDAPRLNYYFRGNSKTKELRYYKRYIKRIINSYAENDPDKYIEAMKTLLTSYTKYDYVCKFPGNFQFNELLKYYLYYDFKEKPPTSWESWYERQNWMANDQLMKLSGRYEFKKEIWDNHLKDVLEIATMAKINPVLKGCYYILKESEKTKELVESMSIKELVSLTEGSYEPLVDMFKEELYKKLHSITVFDSVIMISLMASSIEENHEIARRFFEKTEGAFSSDDIVNLICLNNIDIWINIFKESIFTLENNDYCNFVKTIIKSSEKFRDLNISLSKEIKDILSLSTGKIEEISEVEKADFILSMISEMFNVGRIEVWIEELIEEIIFSISYEELENVLNSIKIESKGSRVSQRSRQVISILESIQNKNLPSDSEIISILETGSSKMINMLADAFMVNTEELSNRNSTLLIMLESDITLLNKRAEEIFENMEEDKRKELHGIIIDSPVNKVYSFGLKKLDELYSDLIPADFVIQMLEHTSSEVKSYISNKTDEILNNLGNGDKELFMYYLKTIIFLPNKISRSKDNLYKVIPRFLCEYKDKLEEVQNILLDIGGSNIIVDSERALTTLAKIRKEVVLIEG